MGPASDDRIFACPQGWSFRSRTFIKGNLLISSTDPALDPVVAEMLGPGVVDIESVS